MAAEVRGWLLDLETRSGGGAGDGGKEGMKGEMGDGRVAVRVRIEDVRGGKGGCGTVLGSREGGGGGGEVKMLLSERGPGEGLKRAEDVERGRIVGVRRPVWEVELDGGERWGVGAGWSVVG